MAKVTFFGFAIVFIPGSLKLL